MQMPRPSGRGGDLAFDLHQIIDLASLGILLLFWLWTVVRRYEHGFSDLVPWFSSARRKAAIEDLGLQRAAIRKGKFPQPAEKSGMAANGAVVYVLTGANGAVTGLGAAARDAHRALANLMWAYLTAHASIALLHQMKGQCLAANVHDVKSSAGHEDTPDEDDEPTAGHIIKSLRQHGHVVDHATNGCDGLFLAAGEPYDVMIVDRMLLGLDGLGRSRPSAARAQKRRCCF